MNWDRLKRTFLKRTEFKRKPGPGLKRSGFKPKRVAYSKPGKAISVKPKRKYVKKTPRQLLILKLDNLFSFYIRLRDKRLYGGICPLCSKRPIEVCFHHIPRGNYKIRWDPMNATGSCKGCNMLEFMKRNLDFRFDDWHIRTHGQEVWDRLNRLKRETAKFSQDDLQELCDDFRKRIEAL